MNRSCCGALDLIWRQREYQAPHLATIIANLRSPTGNVGPLQIPRDAALEVSMTRNESSWLPPGLVSSEFWAAADS